MKKLALPLFLFFIIFSCVSTVLALEINLNKENYLQEETFLGEINAEFLEQLTIQNVFFKQDDKEVGLAFYLLKISDQQYYVWVDLPEKTGSYSFGIENIIYKEDSKLTGKTKQVDFTIKQAIALTYQDLTEQVEDKWDSLDTGTNSLALLSLAWDDSLASQGLSALNEKSKNGEEECWPSTCNIKETALAMLAKAEVEETGNLGTSWLQDSQNNLDLGLWDLSINSQNQQECQLQINNDKKELNLSQGTNTVNLDLNNKPEEVTIVTNCSSSSISIVHTYLGKLNEFSMQEQGNEYTITLNNKKCYGEHYRTECDLESSAYAALAIDKLALDDNGLFTWLKDNAETTKQKAIALYLKDSSVIKEWLINNQHQDGYWSSSALLESEEPDFEATVFSILALEKRRSQAEADRGRAWLKEQLLTGDLKNKATALGFIFTKEYIEPLVTFNPGVIKTTINNTINIEIKNNGISEIEINALFKPFNLEQTLTITTSDSKTLSLDIPDKVGKETIKENLTGSIELNYETGVSGNKRSYTIPIVIFPKKEKEEVKVKSDQFKFELSKMEATLLVGETNLLGILLRNLASIGVGDISLSYTRDLKKILTIEPDKIDKIKARSSKVINLTIQNNKEENLSGEIIAESTSQNVTTRISIAVSFTENESMVKIPVTAGEIGEDKKCEDFNGTICKEDERCDGIVVKTEETERCCFDNCVKKSNLALKIIGIVMITLAVAIIAAFIFFKLKKPRKQEKDLYEKIEKKYSKFGRKIEPSG